MARTTWIGPSEEALPLIIDDALVGVEPSELFKLLDMVVRLSTRTQIVLSSTVTPWKPSASCSRRILCVHMRSASRASPDLA
jgi:hypothetical protein